MIISAGTLSVGEKFSVGGVTTLLGLGMTFVVLIILICCILLVSLILKKLGKVQFRSKKQKAETVPSVPETSIEDKTEEIDEETMLAIKAALDTYARENASDGKPHDKITIKSVVRK